MFYPIHTEFAATLRRASVKQTDFAKLCGVTARAVNNWCRGRKPIPRWAWIIASHLESLFEEDFQPSVKYMWQEILAADYPYTMTAVTKAWKDLAKQYHPDMGGDISMAEREDRSKAMQRINLAFEAAKRELSA